MRKRCIKCDKSYPLKEMRKVAIGIDGIDYICNNCDHPERDQVDADADVRCVSDGCEECYGNEFFYHCKEGEGLATCRKCKTLNWFKRI